MKHVFELLIHEPGRLLKVKATESPAEGFINVWVSAFRSHHPSVAGAELPLASDHSSLVAVGSLHFPWQVLDLCLQLGLLVLKLYKIKRNGKSTQSWEKKTKNLRYGSKRLMEKKSVVDVFFDIWSLQR